MAAERAAGPGPAGVEQVGMRELTHHTADIITRVRSGVIVDVTQYGHVVARIVPVERPGVYEGLVGAGVITPAQQPGFLPALPVAEPDTAASDEVLLDRYGPDAR
jgi:antitoxin (DNA-binding transcriptional repressor) of toxin-antitoxin stability system